MPSVPPKRPGAKPSRFRSDRPVAETKQILLEALRDGHTVVHACEVAGRSLKTYESYRKNDRDFAAAVDRIRVDARSAFDAGHRDGSFPDFPEFSRVYLHDEVFPHGLNVVDLVEGREPRWMHPSMLYVPGEEDLVMVNMPPEHGKSTTVTMNYVAYRIHKDPNIRVIIVSKTQMMAQKFLFGIKERLTHPRYREMHARFGPPNGWDAGSESWTQSMIYVTGDSRDSGEKDPTVQALGIRGHIYGARADLIILDDCVDGTNAHEFDKQVEWIQGEVLSRISASGACLVVGTRLATRDLYLELRDPKRYPEEVSPWTYLSMPAVLEFADDPRDWITLWPRSNRPEIGARGDMAVQGDDGLYPKWDGPRLYKKRGRMQPRTWALLYQQQQVVEDAVFPPELVKATINGSRLTGLIPRDMPGCRAGGMDGLVVVAGLDPAMAGHTAAVAIALDYATQRRHVLDVSNKPGMTPDAIRDLIKTWTDRYGITEWRVEKNAFQSMLTQDREVREYLATKGCILREHFTGTNKWDDDFGVASMTTLFQGAADGRALIELPSTQRAEGVKALVEQLVTWYPDVPKGHKTDCVMALWFTELACRDRLNSVLKYSRSHQSNPFLTRRDKRMQRVVNIRDLELSGWGV